jgi:hypothetical protein
MIRQRVIAILSLGLLAGCFDTATRLTGEGIYDRVIQDGLYYRVCDVSRPGGGVASGGVGRISPKSGMTLTATPLADGRLGVEIRDESVMLAEVMPLRDHVRLVGIKEADKTTFENFLVVTAPGVTDGFATINVSEAVESQIAAADATGDPAAIRAVIATAIDNGAYRLWSAYLAASSITPAADGTVSLPPAWEALGRAAARPMPSCE